MGVWYSVKKRDPWAVGAIVIRLSGLARASERRFRPRMLELRLAAGAAPGGTPRVVFHISMEAISGCTRTYRVLLL